MKRTKPILVTGAPRSGTTWVGRMIATSPAVELIYEPFSINHDMRICQACFENWFTYVGEHNEHEYHEHLKRTIEFQYKVSDLEWKISPGYYAEYLKRYVRHLWQRGHIRPLLKDPIAVFSAEWLALKFDMDTVVMIRHPAAFVASYKALNWTHDFSHFLNQPLLMNGPLQLFQQEIDEFANNEKDIIDQAALLWNLIYYMVLQYKARHPDWLFVRHEDISRNPLLGFRALFAHLNLDFSANTEEAIKKHSFPDMVPDAEAETGFHRLRRDSLANIDTWKQRLTHSEIERIKFAVREISPAFYAEDEW